MSIGEIIKQIRKEKGYTQIEVAEKAGIAVNSLRLYEAGKRIPKIEQLTKIATALNVPTYSLINSHISSEKALSNMRQLTRTLVSKNNPNAQFPAESPLQEIADSFFPLTDYDREEFEHKALWQCAIENLEKAGLDFSDDTLSREEFGMDFYHHSDIFFQDSSNKKLYKIEYEKFERRIDELISFVKYTVNQLIAEASEE